MASKNNKKTMKNNKRRKNKLRIRRMILGLLIAVIVIFLSMLFYVLKNENKNAIYKNIYVGSINLSNQKPTDAVKLVKKHIKELSNIPFTYKVDKKSTEIKLKDIGFKVNQNPSKLVNEAYNYTRKGNIISRFFRIHKAKNNRIDFDFTYSINSNRAGTTLRDRLPKFKNGAVNATLDVSGSKPKVIKGKNGAVLDKESTINTIKTVLSNDWDQKSHTIKVDSKIGKPEIEAKDLKKVKDVLADFTTEYIAGTDSAVNIESGCRHIDGTILLPNEEMSANSLMEPYTEEEGYGMANSYAGGGVVQTMGGGICQVSTTLYNALIFSEIEITRRSSHSMPIAYVPLGRDAAISDTSKDLCFKNNTDAPIYISGQASGGVIKFTIYGHETRDPNRTISFQAEIDDKPAAEYEALVEQEKREREQNPNLPPEKDKTIKVVLYKIVYKNGEEISSEEFNESNYLIKAKKSEEDSESNDENQE